jgi:hypothetical protein
MTYLSKTGSSGIHQELMSGSLVVMAPSNSTPVFIDPVNHSSPITTALNKASSTNRACDIILPYGSFQDSGVEFDTVDAYAARIRGAHWGKVSNVNSEIVFTGNQPGFIFNGYQSGLVTFENCNIAGQNQSYPAIKFASANDGTVSYPRGVTLKNIWMEDWGDSTNGLIHYSDSHAFSTYFENIFTGSHAGPFVQFDSNAPFMTLWNNIYPDGSNNDHAPVIDCNARSPITKFSNLNVGGGYNKIFDGPMYSNGKFICDLFNYEPRSLSSTGHVFDVGAGGQVKIGLAGVSTYSGLDSFDSVVHIGNGYGKHTIDNVYISSSNPSGAVNNGPIYIDGAPDEPSFYTGTSDKVQNITSNNHIFCAGDAPNA